MKISAVVLTYNEEKCIGTCMKSLRFCDEIIVVDDFSTDKTLQIVCNYTGRIFKRALDNDFATQRNFGMNKATGDWIFFVDADETISPELAKEIKTNLEKNYYDGFAFKRDEWTFGQQIEHGVPQGLTFLRLIKKGTGAWKRRVHEYFVISGRTTLLNHHIKHYHTDSVATLINQVDEYSTSHALANMEEGKKSNLTKIIFWPLFKFIDYVIVKRGFLDGNTGFVYALLMAFHSFLAWSKLWLMQKQKSSKA